MRGFTLIEMLVVLVIISILASLTLVGVLKAFESSRSSSTRHMILEIKSALESYQNRFDDYPPTSLDAFKVPLPNDTNNGVESMLACLATNSGGPFYQPPEDRLANLDKDSLTKNVTNWYFGDNQLREVIDFFGNPIIYFHFRDYQKPRPGLTKYTIGGSIQVCKPAKSKKTGTFHNPNSFQIWSVGPDGKNQDGGGDDIGNW